MRAILVNPPIRLPRTFAHYPMFSTLGLLTNAAWLRKHGYDTRIVDAFTLTEKLNLREDGDGFRHIGAEVDALAGAVEADARDADSVCIIVTLTMFSDMNRLTETLIESTVAAIRTKLPHTPIGLADLYTCGMNYFPYDPLEVLRRLDEAQWILVGEGEPTLPTLLTRMDEGARIDDLPRVADRDDAGNARFNSTAPGPLEELDTLPIPAFDLLDMKRYFSAQADAIEADLVHEYHVVERQLPLMTSRSCPYRCRFCTNQVLGLPWRSHSVEYLRRAVSELRERYAFDRLLLLDDNINIDRDRFRDLVTMFETEGIAWDAVNGFRADRLDRHMVRAIKAAGNTKITVSAESGDPTLLKQVIKKGLKLKAIVSLAKLCHEERIPLQVHYIIGVPGETKTQMNKTLEFATELYAHHGAWPLLQHAIPFPGTQMYRDCEEQGYFIAPPESISGARLEEESIIQTPDFEPDEVVTMKKNAQHLHRALLSLAHLSVESRCDNDCVVCHCTPAGKRDISPTSLSREELAVKLDLLRFWGTRELFFDGGEPTLHTGLHELVADAKTAGIERVKLITNAHGFASSARAKTLIEAGVDGLIVDLHGPRATVHDAATRVDGSFALTLAGLRQARAAGISRLEANIPVRDQLLEDLPATVHLAHRLGFASVHLIMVGPEMGGDQGERPPRWDRAKPWLAKALDAAPVGFASIQGAPLCLWNERQNAVTPSPPWMLQHQRRHRAKLETCKECVALILCGGFYRPEHAASMGLDEPPGLTSSSSG